MTVVLLSAATYLVRPISIPGRISMTLASRRTVLAAGMLALGPCRLQQHRGSGVGLDHRAAWRSKADLTAAVRGGAERSLRQHPGDPAARREGQGDPGVPQHHQGRSGHRRPGRQRRHVRGRQGRRLLQHRRRLVRLQIGAQSFSQAYFFNTAEALKTFRETKGFQLGAGATAVAADFGANGRSTSSTLQKPRRRGDLGPVGPDGRRHDRGCEDHRDQSLISPLPA